MPRIYLVWMLTTVSANCGGGSSPGIPPDNGLDTGLFPDEGFPQEVTELSSEPGADALDPGMGEDRIDEEGPLPDIPGGTGWPCQDNAECLSGYCVETPEGQRCTNLCADSSACPEGFTCATVATSPDVVYACVHRAPRTCRPCKGAADCMAPYSGAKMACEPIQGRWFCLKACVGPQDCGNGETCDAKVCLPPDGKCACGEASIAGGFEGACENANDFGTCPGAFVCTADGPSACDGPAAAVETCNGLDDDCDGFTDEEVAPKACNLTNAYGTCEGKTECFGGKEACQGSYASPEICNGIDDDCDGATDEGFPDADQDGKADCVDEDRDGDGVPDAVDLCPDVPDPDQKDTDQDKQGDACDLDDDGDGVPDLTDNCPLLPNADQSDCDKDGIGDACETDDDADGVADEADNCPCVPNPDQGDMDQDGLGDACDADRDGDGIDNKTDTCPDVPDPDQKDLDGDTVGDACDPDRDGDSVANETDNCPDTANADQMDLDEDGLGDACDDDMDGDGVPDGKDNCPRAPNPGQEDANQNQIGDACEDDWDSDGVPNADDNCAWVSNPAQADGDQDGLGDACDCDIDEDGYGNANPGCPGPDPADNCPTVANPDQANLDGDGLGDACDDDRDGDKDPNETDCAPDDAEISHVAAEVCNGHDDDCNGLIDELDAIGCVLFFYDKDGDGFGTEAVRCACAAEGYYSARQKGDCDDADALTNPSAVEACNGRDDDCDGVTDEIGAAGCVDFRYDGDLDGYGTDKKPEKCLCAPDVDANYTAEVGGDCDDTLAKVNPGAPEVCNLAEDDCDGLVDEEDATGCQPFWQDADGDGFGNGDPHCLCRPDTTARITAEKPGDCADTDAKVHPGAIEACNAIDDDCDGMLDEGLGTTTCGVGACEHAVANCKDGKAQTCDPLEGAGAETCNGIDDDCDDATDENLGTTTCGMGECQVTMANCVAGAPQTCVPKNPGVETCNGKDDDCDGATDEDLGTTTCGKGECRVTVQNCVEGVPRVCVPLDANPETCNNKDDDCNGLTDDGLGTTTCGKGECQVTVQNCIGGQVQACEPKTPGTETCNGKDDDCDGATDEDLGTTTCGKGECQVTMANCVAGAPQTCVPKNPGVEACNGKDDDCDGATDEDLGSTTCGLGACLHTVQNCVGGVPQVCNPVEGASGEQCNGIDDDCDGLTDEELGSTTCGLGVCQHTVQNCASGQPQICDPFQGATGEVCNGKDDDCDGITDEDCTAPCRGLRFDGSDDIVRIKPDPTPANNKPFTWEFWTKITGHRSNDAMSLVANYGREGYGCGVQAYEHSNEHIYTFEIACGHGSAWSPWAWTTDRYQLDAWYHLAMTYDGTKVALFVNGIKAFEASGTVIFDANEPLLIGGRNASYDPNWTLGIVDDVRVWNSVRSQADIAANMNTVLTGTEPGLIAYYRMDQESGQIVKDWTGHGFDGVLGNSEAGDSQDPVWVAVDSPQCPGTGCPAGWSLYKGHCYRYEAVCRTWSDARATCQAAGADLAGISDSAENTWVGNLAFGRYTWLGGNDLAKEGTWVWSDGTPPGFTAWCPSEPNNCYEGCIHDENCLVSNWCGVGIWNDLWCNDTKFCPHSVCEKPL